MAPRKKAPRRRRDTSFRILSAAEGYVQANIVTEALMDVSPIQFVFGDAGPSFAVSGGGISLIEIARNPSLLGTIGKRAMSVDAIFNIAGKSFLANLGFKAARKVLRRPIAQMNRQVFKPLGMGVKL
tara:strand:+ start:72 stop:452 length:381 start_codon:yes stop_codon:yes gene_type:complete